MSGPFRDDGIYVVHITYERARDRWRVDGYFRGHRASSRTCARFGTQQDAELCATTIWRDYLAGLLEAPEPPPVLVQDLVDRFVARSTSKRGRELSPATARAYRTQLQSLVAAAGADWPIIHLTRRHVEAAIRRPASVRSQAQYLRAIRALVRWSIRQGWMPVDITEGVHVDPGPVQLRPFLQPEEIEPFLAACSPAMRVRAGLIIHTGLRAGEAVAARWAWVQRGLGTPTLRIPATDPATPGWRSKGRKVRVIPLSNPAQEFLELAAERWGRDGYILHDADQPIRHDNWCDDVHSACARANERARREAEEAGVPFRQAVTDVDTHGLRRTAGVLWLAAGIDIFDVSRLLGHESVTTTEQAYAGVADSRLASLMDGVNARAQLPKIGPESVSPTVSPKRAEQGRNGGSKRKRP